MQEIRSTSALRFPRLMDYFKYRLLLEDWFLKYAECAPCMRACSLHD